MRANYLSKFKLFALFLCTATLVWSCKDEDGGNEPTPPDVEESAIQIEFTYLDFPAEGGTEEIGFTSDTDWEVVSSAKSWLTVSPTSGASGNNLALQLQADKNEDSAERQAKVVVRTTGGNSADTLTVRQAGQTRYVDIDWEDDATLQQFDLNSGDIRIQFDGTVPNFTPEISTIVVPTDSVSYIRVVKSATTSGNSVSLQTEQGDMTDLFMNQEFTLSTVPATKTYVTRSGQISTVDRNGVIHPNQISIIMEDGRREVLYDVEAATRAENITQEINFFHWGDDFTGEKLYDKDGTILQWDKCTYEAAIDGTFYFNFGSTVEIASTGIQVPKGELYGFFYLLEGSMDIDLLLHLIATSKHRYETEEPLVLIEHVFKPKGIAFKFLTPSGIPIYITVDPSIKAEAFAESEARCDVTGGFNAGVSLKVGVNYYQGSDVQAIEPDLDTYFNLYNPEIKVKGRAEAGVTVFPDINVRLYNFAGFDIQFKPTIGDEFLYGGLAGGTDENYMAWTNRLYQQLDIYGNLSLDFIGYPWKSPSLRLGGNDQIDLIRTPEEIQFVSPENGTEMKINETISAQVLVKDYWLVGESQPVEGAVVKFEAVNGFVDVENAITNADGHATVNYTPTTGGSYLSARILDADGEIISEAVFVPQLKETGTIQNPSIVGTWIQEGIISGRDIYKGDVTVTIKQVLTLNEDGTYSFVENPEKKIFEIIRGPIPEQFCHFAYSYCEGTYTYDKEANLISLNPETAENGSYVTINGELFDEPPLPKLAEKGTYQIILRKDGTLYIGNDNEVGVPLWGYIFDKSDN